MKREINSKEKRNKQKGKKRSFYIDPSITYLFELHLCSSPSSIITSFASQALEIPIRLIPVLHLVHLLLCKNQQARVRISSGG
jgi:hypothetical protein